MFKIFKDSGKKIKFAAPILAIALGVVSIIMSIFFMTLDRSNIFFGLIMLLLGVGLSFLIGLMVYGFGELIELVEKVMPQDEKLASFIPLLMEEDGTGTAYEGDDAVLCSVCGASNRHVAKFCVVCGAEIKEDDSGSEYFRSDAPVETADDYEDYADYEDSAEDFEDNVDEDYTDVFDELDELEEEPAAPVPTPTVTFRRPTDAKKRIKISKVEKSDDDE